jgi:adenylylsulfate kinase
MRILIMGLPGSGKTHLAMRLQSHLHDCAWYNADAVRKMANDWDFSDTGRLRQAERMNTIATFEGTRGRTVICDFVCPTNEARKLFSHEIMIWMNTIEEGRFEDTNKMFQKPDNYTYVVDGFQTDEQIEVFAEKLKEAHHV